MKLLSLTTTIEELRSLVPTLRELYFSCEVDGLSLVTTAEEAALNANPWIHRRLFEYGWHPKKLDGEVELRALATVARKAVLEEQPEVVLLAAGCSLEPLISSCLKEAGIGQYVITQRRDVSLKALFTELKNRHLASIPRPPRDFDPRTLMEEHWSKLGAFLAARAEGGRHCLLLGQQALSKECRARFPEWKFDDTPQRDRYPQGLSLLALTYADAPVEILQTLRAHCDDTLLLEPVNTQLVGARYTLRYGDYDNEFSFAPAEMDLQELLGNPHTTEVWTERKGCAGDHPLPYPDGHHALFASSLQSSSDCWTARYRLPEGEGLRIVFADSGNVAGSVLHHTAAINRFTDSQAWALTLAPHPLIGPQVEDEHTFFVGGRGEPSAALQEVLRQTDCVVFFEDDDERSPAWPFDLAQYLGQHKAILHLYIGYRVHRRTAELQREGRRILTPLPHLLRMYPQAFFYAGFPPLELLDIPLQPPRSAVDGICRILHTPSMPHWTTSRYPYHKDTEAFLCAARRLKGRYGEKLEIHQVGGWSHGEVLQARQVCDLTFNQLRGFHGLSGGEAMFLERPCVQAFDRANVNRHLEYWGLDAKFPWVTSTYDNLEEVLAELIDQPETRAEIGRRSRQFMLKYFSPQKGILPLLYHCYQTVQK